MPDFEWGFKDLLKLDPDDKQLLNTFSKIRSEDPSLSLLLGYLTLTEKESALKEADELFTKGNKLAIAGQHDDAIKCYKNALDIKKDKHEAWYNMGIAYREIGNIENALASHQEAVRYSPDEPLSWYQLAVDWVGQNSVDETAKALKVCFALKPEFKEFFKSDKRFEQIRGKVEKKLL